MTSAGGPSAGPSGLVEPKIRNSRGSSQAASPSRLRSGGSASSPVHATLEVLAPHQLLKRLRQLNPPVRGLMVLQQRHQDARTGQRGVVERVREAHLAVTASIAKVRTPGLPVVKRRAAVRLAIL